VPFLSPLFSVKKLNFLQRIRLATKSLAQTRLPDGGQAWDAVTYFYSTASLRLND